MSVNSILGGLFCHFIGVVEDIHDPEKEGRVRVRIFGIHSEITVPNDATGKGIKPDDLPWAIVMGPTTSANVHGFGMNHGLVEGSWVVGLSRDGEAFNDLIIIGTLPGRPEEKNPNPASPPVAFHGQDGKWPDEEFLDEPDYGRLARGDLQYENNKWKPHPTWKRENMIPVIPAAMGAVWSEKDCGYGAEYTFNQVHETPGRHTVEYDDTPGAERISITHGVKKTFIDLLPDGSIQTKAQGDNYTITMKDNNIYAMGNVNISANGNVGIYSTGNTYLQSLATLNIQAASLVNINSLGPLNLMSTSIISLTAPLIALNGALI